MEVMIMRPIRFPRDELAHGCNIEWWYFNGHLRDQLGRQYSYMHALFKADLEKLGFRMLSKTPLKTAYFTHSILTDIAAKKSYPLSNQIVMLSQDSFTKKQLFINYINPFIVGGYTNYSIDKPDKHAYHIKTEMLNLNMSSLKKPMLEGGKGFIDFGESRTYYYSLTRLKTRGHIKIGSRNLKVSGLSWMDHQWADMKNIKNSWNWFCMQLDNGADLVCFEYKEAGKKSVMADIMSRNGRQENFRRVSIRPVGKPWKSPDTKVRYPLKWKIEIPEREISLAVSPQITKQEIVSGPFNYWEGPIDVRGSFSGKAVSGIGFMELVGRPCQHCRLLMLRRKFVETLFDLGAKGEHSFY